MFGKNNEKQTDGTVHCDELLGRVMKNILNKQTLNEWYVCK